MRAWTFPIAILLAVVVSLQTRAQDLRLAIEQTDQTFTLTVSPALRGQNTFVEFATNGVWLPAYFTRANSDNGLVYMATNTGGIRLFRASQAPTIADQVKASWERLGATNYVFDYIAECFCAVTGGTVTVISNKVAKVENVRDRQGDPVPNPELYGFTISSLFDTWIWSEPSGGVAMALEFDSRGVPTYISLDPLPGAVDDEVGYRIDNFTPLQ